jgi:uncharacterized protein
VTAAPVHLAGERLMLDPMGALYWPAQHLLVVSDLHLEKGSSFARKGMLLPPWDTHATLERLALLLRRWQPAVIVALGDSFHDAQGSERLPRSEVSRLAAMTEAHRFIWIQGNHDPCPPAGLGGEWVEEFSLGPLLFRHQALERHDIVAAQPPRSSSLFDRALQTSDDSASDHHPVTGDVAGEIVGHHHPKAMIQARSGTVSRPCFVFDGRRLMMPAFGAYTGGLDITDPAIARLYPRGGRVFLLGTERLFSFAFTGRKGAWRDRQASAV